LPLRTDGNAGARVESLVRFDVVGVSGTITSVKLRLFAASSTANGPGVYPTSTRWSESGVTWQTRPAATAAAFDNRGAISAGTLVDWNVSAGVKANGTFAFVLKQSSSDGINFRSREQSSGPQLIVTTADGCGSCDDGNACTLDTCDTTTNTCDHDAATDGTACTAGDECATSATCQAGKCVATSTTGCSGGTSFQKSYGGSGDDKGYQAIATSDGGAIVVGRTNSYGAGSTDIHVVKTDACGAMQWQRTYGGSAEESGNGILKTSDGGYLLLGESRTWSGGLLVKITSSGSLQWTASYGGGGYDAARKAVQVADGGYVVIGETYSLGPEVPRKHNNLIFKVSASGSLLWSRVYGGTVEGDAGFDIVQAGSGVLVVGGTESYGYGNDDIWLLRLDSDGYLVYSIAYGSSGDDEARGVQATKDGGFIITGFTRSFGAAMNDALLLKVDANGGLQWLRRYGGFEEDEGHGVLELSDGYMVSGFTGSFGNGGSEGFLLRTGLDGKIVYMRTFGGSDGDQALSLARAGDGGFYLGGFSHSYAKGYRNAWLVKARGNGTADCSTDLISTSAISTSSVYPKKTTFTPVYASGAVRFSASTKVNVSSTTGATYSICGCN